MLRVILLLALTMPLFGFGGSQGVRGFNPTHSSQDIGDDMDGADGDDGSYGPCGTVTVENRAMRAFQVQRMLVLGNGKDKALPELGNFIYVSPGKEDIKHWSGDDMLRLWSHEDPTQRLTFGGARVDLTRSFTGTDGTADPRDLLINAGCPPGSHSHDNTSLAYGCNGGEVPICVGGDRDGSWAPLDSTNGYEATDNPFCPDGTVTLTPKPYSKMLLTTEAQHAADRATVTYADSGHAQANLDWWCQGLDAESIPAGVTCPTPPSYPTGSIGEALYTLYSSTTFTGRPIWYGSWNGTTYTPRDVAMDMREEEWREYLVAEVFDSLYNLMILQDHLTIEEIRNYPWAISDMASKTGFWAYYDPDDYPDDTPCNATEAELYKSWRSPSNGGQTDDCDIQAIGPMNPTPYARWEYEAAIAEVFREYDSQIGGEEDFWQDITLVTEGSPTYRDLEMGAMPQIVRNAEIYQGERFLLLTSSAKPFSEGHVVCGSNETVRAISYDSFSTKDSTDDDLRLAARCEGPAGTTGTWAVVSGCVGCDIEDPFTGTADTDDPQAFLDEIPAGTHTLSWTCGTSVAMVTVTRDGAAQASLSVSPASPIAVAAVAGETDATSFNLSITNDGEASSTLDWTAALSGTPDDCNGATAGGTTWVALSDSGTALLEGDPADTAAVTFTGSQDCDAGVYEATLSVTSAEADDSPVTKTVQLTVTEPSATTIDAVFVATPQGGVGTCSAPCAVHFDATGTLDSASTREFHSLDYRWDFDDATVGGTWTHSGKSKNADTGAIAGHVYTAPGTYDPVLTVTNNAGATDTYTTTITVANGDTTWAGGDTYCFFNSAVGTGCPSGATEVATSDFDVALGTTYCDVGDSTNKNRCLFKGGDTFNYDSSRTLSGGTGSGQIGAYGTGRPLIVATGPSSPMFVTTGAAFWTITGLDVSLVTTASQSFVSTGEPGESDGITIYDNVIDGQVGSCFNGGGSLQGTRPESRNSFIAYVLNDCEQTVGGLDGGVMLYGPIDHAIFLGNTTDKNKFNGEFVSRHFNHNHTVIAHSEYRGAAQAPRGVRNPLQLRSDNANNSQYTLVHSNKFWSDILTHIKICEQSGCGSTPATSTSNVIIESNLFLFDPPVCPLGASSCGDNSLFVATGVDDVTIRNNVFDFEDNDEAGKTMNINAITGAQIFGNTIYTPEVATGQVIRLTTASGEARGNLAFLPNYAGTFTFSSGGATVSNNIEATANPFVSIPPAPETVTVSDFAISTGGEANGTGYNFDAETDTQLHRDALGTVRGATEDAGAVDDGGFASNEPAGWTQLVDNRFLSEPPVDPSIDAFGFKTFNAEPNNWSIAVDPTALSGDMGVLRLLFPSGHPCGGAPGGMVAGDLAGTDEFYLRAWMKWSSNWTNAGNTGTKFVFPDPTVSTEHNSYFEGVRDDTLGPPYLTGWQTQDGSGPYSGGACGTGATQYASGSVPIGDWYQFEARVKSNTPGTANGEVQIWMDGTEVLDIANSCIYDAGASGTFDGFFIDPTYGGCFGANNPVPVDQYLLLDSWYISVPP